MKTVNMIALQYTLQREELNGAQRDVFTLEPTGRKGGRLGIAGGAASPGVLLLVFRRHLHNSDSALSPSHWASTFSSGSPAWRQV